jgi:Right handed beta helix region
MLTLPELIKLAHADCTVASTSLIHCTGPVRVDGLTKTSVAGHGVRLEFADSRYGKGGIVFVAASDVDFGNLEIAWSGGGARDSTVPGIPRIQSFGDVRACPNHGAGGALTLELPLDGTQPLGAVTVWDAAIGWPWYPSAPDAVEVYLPDGTQTTFAGGKSSCLPQLAVLVGRHVLVRHFIYANHAFQCWGCRNVTVEHVRVTSAPGMGFLFSNGGSNLTLRDNVIEPQCAPHCSRPEPSITADAAHFSGVAGNITLERNNFGWQGDDAVNITGLLIPARAEPAADSSGRWLSVDAQWRSRAAPLTAGSKLLLFDHGLSALGQAEILSVEASTGRIKVSQLPPATAAELILAGADTVPKQVVIRNNTFHDNRARGLLIGASDALIEHNVIERVTAEAILIPADTGPWYEGPGAQNVTIKDNQISDVNRYADARNYPSAISAAVSTGGDNTQPVGTPIRHIRVEGNTFTHVYSNASTPVFFGRGVADGQIR